MVKHRWWDTWVGVSDLLYLIGQPEHHFSQQLGVGFKHIGSMSLVAEKTVSSYQYFLNKNKL